MRRSVEPDAGVREGGGAGVQEPGDPLACRVPPALLPVSVCMCVKEGRGRGGTTGGLERRVCTHVPDDCFSPSLGSITIATTTHQNRPGARAPGLDPRYHYVINGVYVSVIERDVWVLALGIRDTMPETGA